MAGLMDAMQPATDAAGMQALEQAPAPDENGGVPASPEEQDLYNRLVERAEDLLFEGDGANAKFRKGIIEALKEENPQEALGQTAATVFHRVIQAAADAGQKVPGDVKEAAGEEVYSVMAEAASNLGIHNFMEDQQAFDAGWLIAADHLRVLEQESGTLDQDEAAAEFQQLAEMDQDGRLEQIMAGLGGAA